VGSGAGPRLWMSVADTIMLDGSNVSWEGSCISHDRIQLEGCGDTWVGMEQRGMVYGRHSQYGREGGCRAI